MFLTYYKEYYLSNALEDDLSIDDLYIFYCNMMNDKDNTDAYSGLIVDKAYFSKKVT